MNRRGAGEGCPARPRRPPYKPDAPACRPPFGLARGAQSPSVGPWRRPASPPVGREGAPPPAAATRQPVSAVASRFRGGAAGRIGPRPASARGRRPPRRLAVGDPRRRPRRARAQRGRRPGPSSMISCDDGTNKPMEFVRIACIYPHTFTNGVRRSRFLPCAATSTEGYRTCGAMPYWTRAGTPSMEPEWILASDPPRSSWPRADPRYFLVPGAPWTTQALPMEPSSPPSRSSARWSVVQAQRRPTALDPRPDTHVRFVGTGVGPRAPCRPNGPPAAAAGGPTMGGRRRPAALTAPPTARRGAAARQPARRIPHGGDFAAALCGVARRCDCLAPRAAARPHPASAKRCVGALALPHPVLLALSTRA